MSGISRRTVLGGLCSCSYLALMGCAATNAPEGRVSAGYRPPTGTDENDLWATMDRAERDLAASRQHVRDTALDSYIHEIACRLAGDHCSDVRIYIMRTPAFNASMAPNGMMQVWTGLLLRCQSEAQVAAVMGHEMGHYLERHTLQRFRDVRSKSEVGAFLGMAGLPGALANVGLLASIYSFSRDQEREADSIGLELMSKAGYEPTEAWKVWEQMIAELDTIPDRSKEVFFATHPQPEERLATLRSKAESLKSGETFTDRYREKMEPLRQTLFEDELRLRQYDRSLALFKIMTDRGGEDGMLAFYTAEVYRLRDKDGDRGRAREALDRALTLGNAPPELYRSAGLLRWRDGAKRDAIAEFETYLRLRPDASDRAMIQAYMQQAI